MARSELATFQNGSIRFYYPSTWHCEVEQGEEGVSVVLQSQGVTFGIVGIYSSDQNPQNLIDQAVDSLREEHPQLEAEDVSGQGEGIGREIVFISLDTISYCWMRSWVVGDHTTFVMLQSIEPESTQSQAVFRAICESVISEQG